MYKIGMFDSGVGGLTVLTEVIKKFPKGHIIYFGDNLNAPYGDKSKEEIERLSLKIGGFFNEMEVDAIVIACNTATAAALNKMKKVFSIPVVGVIVPGVRESLKSTNSGKVAAMMTPACYKTKVYKEVFKDLAPNNFTLLEIKCKKLCMMIENGWKKSYPISVIDKTLEEYLVEGGVDDKIDTLILACTHYPLIIDDIRRFFNKKIVDPALETAITLYETLNGSNPRNKISAKSSGKIEYFVSGDIDRFKEVAENTTNLNISNIKLLTL